MLPIDLQKGLPDMILTGRTLNRLPKLPPGLCSYSNLIQRINLSRGHKHASIEAVRRNWSEDQLIEKLHDHMNRLQLLTFYTAKIYLDTYRSIYGQQADNYYANLYCVYPRHTGSFESNNYAEYDKCTTYPYIPLRTMCVNPGTYKFKYLNTSLTSMKPGCLQYPNIEHRIEILEGTEETKEAKETHIKQTGLQSAQVKLLNTNIFTGKDSIMTTPLVLQLDLNNSTYAYVHVIDSMPDSESESGSMEDYLSYLKKVIQAYSL